MAFFPTSSAQIFPLGEAHTGHSLCVGPCASLHLSWYQPNFVQGVWGRLANTPNTGPDGPSPKQSPCPTPNSGHNPPVDDFEFTEIKVKELWPPDAWKRQTGPPKPRQCTPKPEIPSGKGKKPKRDDPLSSESSSNSSSESSDTPDPDPRRKCFVEQLRLEERIDGHNGDRQGERSPNTGERVPETPEQGVPNRTGPEHQPQATPLGLPPPWTPSAGVGGARARGGEARAMPRGHMEVDETSVGPEKRSAKKKLFGAPKRNHQP